MPGDLTPDQHRAAELLARGRTQREVAGELGVHARTVKRWAARPEFQRAVDKARQAVLDAEPTARSVLESALHATKGDGQPDWQIRVQAARALLNEAPPGETDEERVRETVIHLDRLRGAS